ncbi:hypothetical protein ACWA6H_10875 [Pseudomonas bijieensis]
MIYTTTASDKTLRIRLLRWTQPLLLSVTCCVLTSHQLALTDLGRRLVEQADSTVLQHLQDRIMELELSALDTQQGKNTVTHADLSDLNAAIKGRVTDIEKAIAVTVSQADLQALIQRVELVESWQKKMMQAPPQGQPPRRTRISKKVAEPTFKIFGFEMRGGESFLSVGPRGAQALGQTRLIRIGESYAGWRLESIDEQFAVFVADGVTQRLSIHQERSCPACS